jgi:hypothetical protein
MIETNAFLFEELTVCAALAPLDLVSYLSGFVSSTQTLYEHHTGLSFEPMVRLKHNYNKTRKHLHGRRF